MEKVERLMKQSQLGERFKERTFDKFNAYNQELRKAFDTCLRFTDNFEQIKKKGIGIIITGTYGVGKSHLAAAIANNLINKGTPVIINTLIRLLGRIKDTYSSNYYDHAKENESQILDLYSKVDLLIINDLGKEKPSEWMLEKLYTIIDERYENLKPVIITTNYNHETLVDRLTVNGNDDVAQSIISRIYEMCRYVEIKAEDYRKKI